MDTYSSIEDCGKKLPKPDVPGATFLGWTVDTNNHDDVYNSNWVYPMITKDTVFGNCLEWFGASCVGCGSVSTSVEGRYTECDFDCDIRMSQWNNDVHIFEETDHITLYPSYKFNGVDVSFDPNGGYFSLRKPENSTSWFYYADMSLIDPQYPTTDQVAVARDLRGSEPFGITAIPGHETENEENRYLWRYGNNWRYLPVPERDNYVFDKWVYLDANGKEQEFNMNTVVSENMTVSAKWTPGTCWILYDPTDGTIPESELERAGLKASNGGGSYHITTESTIAKDGKFMPVPVSSEGRQFLGWYTTDAQKVTEDTQITSDMTLRARWGTKTDSNPATQKPSTDKDTSTNKDTDSNSKNETVHVTDITVTDMNWQSVDKNNNHYTIEYGGKGSQTGLGFTATVLPSTLKDTARNVIWTSSNPNIISVTAGKEVIYSPNWFDYFEFGTDTGDVVLTVISMDDPNVSFSINVTVMQSTS